MLTDTGHDDCESCTSSGGELYNSAKFLALVGSGCDYVDVVLVRNHVQSLFVKFVSTRGCNPQTYHD